MSHPFLIAGAVGALLGIRKFRKWAREMESDPAKFAAFQQHVNNRFYDIGYRDGRNGKDWVPPGSGRKEAVDAYNHGYEAGYEYRKAHP
jgi:hypothetical protein